MRVEVYKCYLVEVVDEEGNELYSEYIFTDRKDAIRQGKEMKAELMKEMQEEQENNDEIS